MKTKFRRNGSNAENDLRTMKIFDPENRFWNENVLREEQCISQMFLSAN